jgi:protein gp37
VSDKTAIAWCDATWNPFRGCSRVSPGCQNCYAERMCARGLPGLKSPIDGDDFAERRHTGPHWTGRVELIKSALEIPLRWRKPRRIFVNSMSDTFHERVSDGCIHSILDTMRLADRHTYIVCTKRIQRARMVMPLRPLPNVILLASVEDQQRADERIPDLLAAPAAVRGISLEPMLGPVNLRRIEIKTEGSGGPVFLDALTGNACSVGGNWQHGKLSWVIVGGESGPGARPCNVEWIRDVVRQCREAGVACFVKQLGARPVMDLCADPLQGWPNHVELRREMASPYGVRFVTRDSAGADPSEWPADLRVQEFPA